jgi:Domain of unknown function (DUF4440)
MKGYRVAMILVLWCIIRLPCWAQDQKGQKAPTGLEVFFSKLETQWLSAEQDKDPAALNRVVADDFHLWTSAPPGSIPREEWFAGIFGRKFLSGQLRQLAVRDLSPEIAVVSFVKTETFQQTPTPQTEESFVVDIWINKGSGDNWRCTDRYVSRLQAGLPPERQR